MLAARIIDRRGTTTGRWPNYRLIVDGVDLGSVRRTIASGGGTSRGDIITRDAWEVQGWKLPTQAEAEAKLIERGITFGKIPSLSKGELS